MNEKHHRPRKKRVEHLRHGDQESRRCELRNFGLHVSMIRQPGKRGNEGSGKKWANGGHPRSAMSIRLQGAVCGINFRAGKSVIRFRPGEMRISNLQERKSAMRDGRRPGGSDLKEGRSEETTSAAKTMGITHDFIRDPKSPCLTPLPCARAAFTIQVACIQRHPPTRVRTLSC